jgi:endoglucanase
MKIVSLFAGILGIVAVSIASAQATFSDQRDALVTTALPQVAVEGNRFVDPDGETLVFRGIAMADPAALSERGEWNRGYFEAAAEWNANVVRVPVHPLWWREYGEEQYLEWLDQAVQWSTELGMYVIIDWHTIGNLLTGVYHRDIYVTSRDETFRFWNTMAQRYRGNTTVAFFELVNEPTNRGGQFGRMPWMEYKAFIEDLIYMIYANDDTIIPLVAGFDWGYDLRPVRNEPIQMPGVAYVTHPYPQKNRDAWRSQDWDAHWQEIWGFVAERYPVFATEFGFMEETDRGAHIPCIGDEVYGEALIAFMEERGISWTPWVFDHQWTPRLITGPDFTPSRQGEFFKQKLQKLNASD